MVVHALGSAGVPNASGPAPSVPSVPARVTATSINLPVTDFRVPDPNLPIADEKLAKYFPRRKTISVSPAQHPVFRPAQNLMAVNVDKPEPVYSA